MRTFAILLFAGTLTATTVVTTWAGIQYYRGSTFCGVR